MKEIVLDHPLIKHKMAFLRSIDTGTKEFRELACELSMLLTYEAMKGEPVIPVDVETPMGKTTGHRITESKYAFVPILRAGLGMAEGVLKVLPNAKIGHIGLFRDEESLKPVTYYFKMPSDISKRAVFLLDPMLATGGSACAAIEQLKEKGVKDIRFLCIVAAPEGIDKVKEEHPDVQIYAAALDDCLNDIGYIVPGLGDAGDRIFGTK
jgi:uracil phosphoribosyltransferase